MLNPADREAARKADREWRERLEWRSESCEVCDRPVYGALPSYPAQHVSCALALYRAERRKAA